MNKFLNQVCREFDHSPESVLHVQAVTTPDVPDRVEVQLHL